MSAPREPQRPMRFAALPLALLFHGGLLALGIWRPAPPASAALPRTVDAAELEVALLPESQPETQSRGDAESGGGSIEAGREEIASGTAPVEPVERIRSPVSVKEPPRATEPEPPEAPEPNTLEHGNAEAVEPVDLVALDALLTSDAATDVIPLKLKPRPAWRSTVSPQPSAAPMEGEQGRLATHYGTSAGRGGGPGGMGKGATGRSGDSAQPFGGREGAFRGSVCFVPEGTRSLAELGSCRVELELFTDVFDTPTTEFTRGFPGIPRDEWFAIVYTGRFDVAKSGDYEFRLASDDGSILQIDGQLVVDNDGLHGPVAKRGRTYLIAGEHYLRLRYFQGPRTWVSLQLWVTPPGGPERLFGPSF